MADETGIPPKLEAFLTGRCRISQVELDSLVSTVASPDGTRISKPIGATLLLV